MVEIVTDADHADHARRGAPLRSRSRARRRDRREGRHLGLRAHPRADGQAGDHPAHPRGRARHRLRGVQGSQGRDRERHRPALREGRDHRRPRPRRGRAAAEGAGAARDLSPERPHPRLRDRRQQGRQGRADHPLARLHRDADEALRAGGAGDVRGHRHDPGRRARAGRALEDRRGVARQRRRSGRRLRRHEGQPRAGGRAGAARRAHRHRAVEPGSGALRVRVAVAGAGLEGDHRRGARSRWT